MSANGTRSKRKLVGLGLLLAFVVLEVGLRIWVAVTDSGAFYDTATPVRAMRFVSHPFLPYAGRPNARFELANDGVPEVIVTNSYGFRAHEFPEEKRPEDYFVLCFGESTTFGYRAPTNADTWPERLERLLQERYPQRNVKVFNLGVDNATSAFSVVNMGLIGVHVRPDLVIAYHGYNDVDAMGDTQGRTDHSHFYKNLEPGEILPGYQAALPQWLTSLSYTVFVATGALDRLGHTNDLAAAVGKPHVEPAADPLFGLQTTLTNFRTLRALTAGIGGQMLFSTFQFRDGDEPRYQRYNQALRQEFSRQGWAYVDQDALLPDHDATINVDPCHFTQEGRDRMARNFFDYIVAHDLVRPMPDSD